MLDAIRYMIVWNPLIFLIFSVLVSRLLQGWHVVQFDLIERTKAILGQSQVAEQSYDCLVSSVQPTHFTHI
jgi:hypothetical protein